MPIFETDDSNAHFLATMLIHQAFVDEKTYLASIGKELDIDDPKDDPKELSDRQRIIFNLLKGNGSLTREQICSRLLIMAQK